MTLQELNDTVQYLLIGLGMFVIATYLVFVMFGAFNESRKTHNTQKDINKYLVKHLLNSIWLLAYAFYCADIVEENKERNERTFANVLYPFTTTVGIIFIMPALLISLH